MMRTHSLVLGIFILWTLPLYAQDQVFLAPAHEGFRIDFCRSWGQGCGEDAASTFCRLQGYDAAVAFEMDPDIGAGTPTRTLDNPQVCDQPFCDGFKEITCMRESQPPPPHSIDPPVVPPGDQPIPPPPEPPAEPPPAPAPIQPSAPPWTPKEVMDSRIDVQAQYALFRMFKGSVPQRVVASHILSAVKAEALKGVYQEDQQVPAMRAQELGKWWGQILPAGTDSLCLTEPAAKPPVIVMRRGTPVDVAKYDQALADAWAQCLIPANWPVRPYDSSAPGDPASTGVQKECHGQAGLAAALQECEDYKKKGFLHCENMRESWGALFNIQFCIDEVSGVHANCQQFAVESCR